MPQSTVYWITAAASRLPQGTSSADKGHFCTILGDQFRETTFRSQHLSGGDKALEPENIPFNSSLCDSELEGCDRRM